MADMRRSRGTVSRDVVISVSLERSPRGHPVRATTRNSELDTILHATEVSDQVEIAGCVERTDPRKGPGGLLISYQAAEDVNLASYPLASDPTAYGSVPRQSWQLRGRSNLSLGNLIDRDLVPRRVVGGHDHARGR